MFDDAALVLEEIAPEDKNRNEVLGARVNLYMVAKKWDMAVSVASRIVVFSRNLPSGEHRKIGLTVEIGFPTRCRPV